MTSAALSEATIIDQFRAAMAERGLPFSGTIKADANKITRYTVDGDRKQSLTGWYILHTDGLPAGEFGCWKRGVQATWCAKSENTLTDAEREQLRIRREENERRRQEEQERVWAEAAAKAEGIWTDAQPCDTHPYLTRKGVPSHGLRVGRWTRTNAETGEVWLDIPNALLVPIRHGKKLASLQAIFPDKSNPSGRDKDFLTGGRKRGCMFAIGKPNPAQPVIVVCEGYSTGASIHAATGYPVLVAFDRGNLQPVAEKMRGLYPDAEIIIAADNDRWTTKPYPNPGVRNATEAAEAVKGRLVIPDFVDLDGDPTDFNDLHQREGLERVAAFINGSPEPVPAPAPQAANDNPPPAAKAAVIVPANIHDMEAGMSEYFRVLGLCGERRVWVRDERTGELRAFKESELARKATLISLAPVEMWTLAIGCYIGPEAKFTADSGFSFIMDIAKAKPPYVRPRTSDENEVPDRLTGQHGADSAIIAAKMRHTTLFDEFMSGWYCWNTIWRPVTEGDVNREIMGVLDASFNMQYDVSTFNGTFNLLKKRLGRSPQMNKDHSAAFDGWNRDKNLLPMRNGVLNLTTSQLLPHAPELMMPWLIPHDYTPGQDCPITRRFLFALAQEDEATYHVLLCFLAAVLHGRADLQKYLECIGIAGTGKSTYIKLCQSLVGEDNVAVTTMQQLHQNRFETASLYGKRLAVISDADKYGGSVDVFKAITGQDPVRYEEKNKQTGKPFIFGGMVIVAANAPVQFSDSSTAMVRRRIPIHIDKRLAPGTADPRLQEKLDAEIPGLINLLLTLSEDTVSRILRDTGSVRHRSDMRAMCETNAIASWLDENCVAEDISSRIGTAKNPADEYLYSNYALYCEATGRKGAAGLNSFTRSVLDVLSYAGIQADKRVTKFGKAIHGIRLRCVTDDGAPSLLTGEPIYLTK